MHALRSPQDAYRKVDFDARISGANPVQLVFLCYEHLASALNSAIHADDRRDNARKSEALTRALSALTVLHLGLDRSQPIAAALDTFFQNARRTVLDSVLTFDAVALRRLIVDINEIAAAFRTTA
ncbi:MAG: flagellar protein FliS, partial [Sphingomonadales bacterium]|nr:flagellar protein FliS [Sphingomonadales bacterium]